MRIDSLMQFLHPFLWVSHALVTAKVSSEEYEFNLTIYEVLGVESSKGFYGGIP